MPEDNSLDLPTELNECHALIKNLLVQNNQLVSEKNKLELKLKELSNRLALLTRKKYGKKTEELNAIQLKLVFEDLQTEYPDVDLTQLKEETINAIENKMKHSSGGGRKTTQDNPELETKVVVYRLEDKDLVCKTCQNQMTEIGSETTTELDYIPAKFIRIEQNKIFL